MNVAKILINKKYWYYHFSFVALVSMFGLIYLGERTYSYAPPIADFCYEKNTCVSSKEDIIEGQRIFLQRGLMSYGSFWGDGAERGPDFTAEALHQIVLSMKDFYLKSNRNGELNEQAFDARVIREIKENRWNEEEKKIYLSYAQAYAFSKLQVYYKKVFLEPNFSNYIRLGYILSEKEIRALSTFFFWGAWVSSTNRPGEKYTYTHNWPYDPSAGNYPSSDTYLWSLFSILILFLGICVTLYIYGQMKIIYPDPIELQNIKLSSNFLQTDDYVSQIVRKTQKSTYKFFVLAMLLFGLQVLAGIICATDFVRPFGIYLGDWIPFSVARSYHTLFQIFWFFMCWVGYTIFFLPALGKVPVHQNKLINILFYLCFLVGIGALVGIYLGHKGIIEGEIAYWIGSQGWEFMELGRLFQWLLLVAFTLWIFIIYRSVRPWLKRKYIWSIPSWLLYGSGIMVFFLFFGLLVQPESNFAVADFWRWMVVHMWVEVTFEVFTTVIVAYVMVQMNFITKVMAERVIFMAVMMFLFTATIGIAHNFYWIAKPTSIIALGSVFSTLQVLPLLLLTLDAWAIRQKVENQLQLESVEPKTFMCEVWMFILAVNFWNIFGAGVFGSIINLPIINYFEHATYLTNNHAHGAMFGVKGNIALGGMLFCCQHLIRREFWNARLIKMSFWSLNIGIALMMFLDLFPVGVYQLMAVFDSGFWYARSPEIVSGSVFKTLTYFRSLGGNIFVFGGVIPMIWFILSRRSKLLSENNP